MVNFYNLFSNKIIFYVLSRYSTYALLFINSLFIAVSLGPYYLGVWGFITLIIQYINQIDLGISHSANAIVSINKDDELYSSRILGSSFLMIIAYSLSVLLFFLFLRIFDYNLGSKYNFYSYEIIAVFVGVLGYFNTLLSNIFRIYGRVNEIIFNQSAFPVLMLISLLFFKGSDLLYALLYSNLLAFLFSFILYLIKLPVNINFIYDFDLIKKIQTRGFYLFIFNSSFYLIMIVVRLFISDNYSVQTFGYYTFAYNLSSVIVLLLQSFVFLIFPKLINRLSNASNESIIDLFEMIKKTYVTISHFLAHLSVLTIPLFMYFFPQYSESTNAFKVTTLSIIMLFTNSFGYASLLIARNKEKSLSAVALFSLAICVLMAYFFTHQLHVEYSVVVYASTFASFVFILLSGFLGRRELGFKFSFRDILNDVFPFQFLIPVVVSLLLLVFNFHSYLFLIPISLFIFMNFKSININYMFIKDLITNPNKINID